MSRTKRFMAVFGMGVLPTAYALVAAAPRGPTPQPRATSSLQMTILGGFQYVHSVSKNTYDVAYLKEVSRTGCHVVRPTVKLRVLRGTITSTNAPASKTFDINGGVVTFGGTTAVGPQFPPPGTLSGSDQPANPDDPGQWDDMKYVAAVFRQYTTYNGQSNAIKDNWKDFVDGRVELANGSLKARKPTEPDAVHALWTFSSQSGAPTPFKQSFTNETEYWTTVNGTDLTITVTGGPNARTITVAAVNGRIQLSLMAEHIGAPPKLAAGSPSHDFCGFYELLEHDVAVNDRLLPIYPATTTTLSGVTTANPDPGAYCGGNNGERP